MDIIRAVWIYLREKDRMFRGDHDEILSLADRRFKKQVMRAYNQVPFYRKLYRGVNIDNVRGLCDVDLLPVVTKSEVRQAAQDDLIPKNSRYLVPVSTSGTTGAPLTLYVSPTEIVHGLLGYMRALDRNGVDWRKQKMALIVDLRGGSAETGYMKKYMLKRFSGFLKNFILLDTNSEPKKIMQKLSEFQPDFLGGYTGMLAHLALLQKKSHGEIHPEKVASTGSCMDENLKKFIEKTFGCKLFEVYGATESGPVAFECEYGRMHVNEDMVYLELMGKRTGKVTVTKLYGEGTPVIRYTGVSDILKIGEKNCGCGIEGKIIERIYGRDNLAIFRKDGAVITPSIFAKIFSPLVYKLNTNRVRSTKVIQHSFEHIEVRVVLDNRDMDVSDDKIMKEIERNFKKYMGEIRVDVVKVKRVSRKSPTVVSRVDLSQLNKIRYL